jgi:hypothetical protein
MFLPTTLGALATLALLSLFALGLWPAAPRLAPKGWRHELTYYDILLGAALAALLATLTLGSWNPAEITAFDNLSIVGYRKLAFAFAGGTIAGAGLVLVFNAGGWTSYGAAFLAGGGVAAALQAIRVALTVRSGLLWAMFALALAAAGAAAAAVFQQGALAPGRTPPPAPADPRVRRPKPRRTPTGPLAAGLVLLGGLLGGVSPYFINKAREGEFGLGAYLLTLGFAVGALASGLVINAFLLNFPIAGDAITVRDYFRRGGHRAGLAAGSVLGAGWLTLFLVWTAPASANQVRWEWVARFGPPVVTTLAGIALGDLRRLPRGSAAWFAALVLYAAATALGVAGI